MTPTEFREHCARQIAPYAWDDAFWNTARRAPQASRNQEHAKQNAYQAAESMLKALGITWSVAVGLASGTLIVRSAPDTKEGT